MKKIIFSLLILVSGIAYGQGGWIKPNNSYGTISNRASIDSTLFFPTGCGAPSLRGYNLRKSAQYFDSCAAQFWIYNPSTSLWDTLHVGAAASSGWGLTGNSGTTAGTNFIGTTDNVDLVSKANSVEQIRLLASGGINVPATVDSTIGVIFKAGDRFIHNFYLPGTLGQNLFIGKKAGNFTMTGSTGGFGTRNLSIGDSTLFANTTGYRNVAIGINAGAANTTGYENTAVGANTHEKNNTGRQNTAIGAISMQTNTTGERNAALGFSALQFNLTGTRNVAVGGRAMQFVQTGDANVAVGFDALAAYNSSANHNVAVGLDALYYSGGSNNVAVGDSTLWGLYGSLIPHLGYKNVAVGSRAGYHLGDTYPNFASIYDTACIFLGGNTSRDSSIPYTTSLQNMTVIGYDARGTASNQVTLGNNNVTSTLLKGSLNARGYGSGTHTGTATYNAAFDASGNIIEVASSGGTVTGTGTANTMTKWTGTSAIGNGLLTDNGSILGATLTPTSTTGLALTTSTVTSGKLMSLAMTGTAAASNTKTGLAITSSGANSTSSQTVTGQTISVTNTGTTNTNVGASFSASGATYNYGLLVPSGNVGIGTSAPTDILNASSASSGSGITLTSTVSGNAGTLTIRPKATAIGSPADFSITGSTGGRLFLDMYEVKHTGGGGINTPGSITGGLGTFTGLSINATSLSLLNQSNSVNKFLYLAGRSIDGKSAIIFTPEGAWGRDDFNVALNTAATTAPVTASDIKFTIKNSGSVGIGTTSPAASALLDVTSTTKGLLIPRMTTTQKNAISSPASGLSVYDTDLKQPQYYDGVTWKANVGMTFGTAAPAITPAAIGNFFLDTTNKKLYVAVGTGSSADWEILN